MLTGTADIDELMRHAATMPGFDVVPAELEGVSLLKAVYETRQAARTDALPPGLHPSNPPILVVHVWQVDTSPWGPFAMAEARVGCRSGTRPRGFVVGCVVDDPAAAAALASGWGLPTRIGEVVLDRGYDRVAATVVVDDALVCEIVAAEPDPLGPGDLSFTTTMSLAHTPNGPRLVQAEIDHRLVRSERLSPRHLSFDAARWGHRGLDPYHPVAAAITLGAATLPELRFVCRPDESAFTGTERVGTDAG